MPKIPELVAAAKEAGCEAIALTDKDNLYGAIEFYKECKKQGLKPIIGLDAHVGDPDASAGAGGKRLLLYAENLAGYQNLLAIVTEAHFASPQNPTVTEAMLKEHANGVIQVDPNDKSYALQEVYYLAPEDRRAWETLCAIGTGKPEDDGDINAEEKDYSFLNAEQMAKKFSPKSLQKTLDLAARVNLELKLGTWVFPDFGIPKGSSPEKELRKLIEAGLRERGLADDAVAHERIEYEYKIITDKGYAPYFLTVADLINFARKHKILTTIRGSVAGSLITYVVGITNVNPLDYKLPFERFLNPERPSAPDIDMDYA
ncbi:MAG: PHP domain-containing protein, partial [Patescibacteria group bacterium]|nr:PHP domain-containing protein [Patescibacteria group bacterium]